MRAKKNIILFVLLLIAAVTTAAISCIGWQKTDNKQLQQSTLASIFNNKENYEDVFSKLQKPKDSANARVGIISHHFLAKELIAEFYNKISSDKILTVFLVSPDHFNNYFKPETIAYTSSLDWDTPFGNLPADKNAVNLLRKNSGVETNNSVLGIEHGIYVEIPFLKNFFPNARIVPLVLKNSSPYDNFLSLGEEIKEISDENSILIVSSDFSHNVSTDRSRTNDKKSINALKKLTTENFSQITNDCKQCFAIASGFLGGSHDDFYLLDNKNSFDISGQDKNSVTSYVSGYYAKKDSINILLVGDLMFDRGIRYYADKNGGNDFIFDKIYTTLLNNDLVVANLEGPITDEKSISITTQPGETDNYFFTFDPSLAKTLFENNIKLVNLGNNHILNFGNGGLDSTKKYLDATGVSYFGAPSGERSTIKDINGVKVAFVNYNEFAGDIDQEQQATIDEIKKVKPESDIVIIYSHWGIEYVPSPNDLIKELAHKFIDAGADLIIGSHPHVIQPMEEYKGKRIYYSLGNFIFDQYFSEDVRRGLGVIVKINKATKQLEFEEINFYLQSGGQTIIVEKNQ